MSEHNILCPIRDCVQVQLNQGIAVPTDARMVLSDNYGQQTT